MRAGKAAGRILDANIANLREHAPAAMIGDVTGIRDLRVAVKRLRESMNLFRRLLPAKRRQRVMPLVEMLNDSLGQVRECDVLRLDAATLAREIEDDGGLLDLADSAWRVRREEAFEDLLGLWSELTSWGLLEALDEIAKRTSKRRRRSNQLDLDRFAYDAIRRAVNRVDSKLGPALESDHPARLHDVRIALKRLKYSIEPFRPVLPALNEPRKIVAGAQEILGTAHDIDVMREQLADHFGAIPPDASPTAESVLRLLDERRGDFYARSRQAIAIFAGPEFKTVLLAAVD